MNQLINNSLSVSRDINSGGRLHVSGSAHFGRNVRIDGWLDAKNIKGPCKGLFLELNHLTATYPAPQPGWWALVAQSCEEPSQQLIADTYISMHGRWVKCQSSAVTINLDCESITNEIDAISGELSGKLDADKLVTLSESEYDALRAKEASTYYFIYED